MHLSAFFSQGISWAVAHVGNVGLNWFPVYSSKMFQKLPQKQKDIWARLGLLINYL